MASSGGTMKSKTEKKGDVLRIVNSRELSVFLV